MSVGLYSSTAEPSDPLPCRRLNLADLLLRAKLN